MELNLTFKLEKETKGAVRYQEVDEAGAKELSYAVGTIYLRKDMVEGPPYPEKLTVTIVDSWVSA